MTNAGWYQDPAAPTMMRWWDGQTWTNAVRSGGVGGPDPMTDLKDETKAGRWASRALLAGAAVYTGQYIVYATLYHSFFTTLRNSANTSAGANGTQPLPVLPHSLVAVDLTSSLFSFALIGVGVVFIIWFEKAATVAKRSGLPARRSPGWAVGGWFVPIANFWFPYQSAVDLFPPGHPGRQKVNRWWGLWLATQFVGVLVVVGSLISSGFGWAAAVVAAAMALSAAMAGRAVIEEVDRAHAALLGR